MSKFISKLLFIIILISSFSLSAIELMPPDQIKDLRFCGFVPRNADGTISRSSTVIYQFRKYNPCPSTGLTSGACPGWSINHIWPVGTGGCDAIINLQWLPNKIKTCKEPWCVDRFERKIRYIQGPIPGFNASDNKPEIIPIETFDNYYLTLQ